MKKVKFFKISLVFTFLIIIHFSLSAQEKDDSKDKKKKKTYSDIITKDTQSDEGLFTIHNNGNDYYFEIPFDLLGEEMLVVSRISGHVKNLNFGGAGMKSRPQQVIRWERLHDNILLRSVSMHSTASFEDPIYESLKKNNFEPIIARFDIAAFNPDSTTALIKVNDLFTKDVDLIGALSKRNRKNFEIKGLDSDRSLISSIRSFPENIEVRHILTYKGNKLPDNQLGKTISVEMNQSFVKLPEIPMQPRYYDPRVGYFAVQKVDYGKGDLKADKKTFITRWRLEPKPEDRKAFLAGKLVEPAKPIVYYIDPATPETWKKYIKQGVEDWQPAFEKAGFKNAIIAKDPPTKEEDPDWSPEDIRYSVIRYITTEIQNAMGPHVHDPRTGEILESDILWYHNILNLLRNWYLTQTAAVDPKARKVEFDSELMGELVRFVAAHEVGHTLGLPHNMGSSVAYPVDSLRSPHFTNHHGTAPSIMDYARFNHIAQPGDGVTQLLARIGEYDVWSIIYGYKPIPSAKTPEAERKILNQWIKERADNPAMRYGPQRGNPFDPSSQTEDLGDDAVKSASYGIKNLKRMVPQLVNWLSEDGEGFEELEEVYSNIYGQFGKYTRHVATNIGGVYEHRKSADQNAVVFTPVDKEKQREALQFLVKEVFTTPTWLLDKSILQRIEPSGIADRMLKFQKSALNRVLEKNRLKRISENEILNPSSAYSLNELFENLRKGIFTNNPDLYQRNLQRAFVDKLAELATDTKSGISQSDLRAMAMGTLEQIKNTPFTTSTTINRYHFKELKNRIEQVLKGNYPVQTSSKK